MKGVILSQAPSARVIDLTHDVPPQDIAAAAFALAQAAPYFPAGTIHVVVVDPGVGGRRRGVIVRHADQLYVGPDNGVFALAAPGVKRAWEITAPGFRRADVSPTFHGRDVFAPCAARLATGAQPEDAGPEVVLEGLLGPRPLLYSHGGRSVTGHVVHVDSFGNLITDIPAEAIPPGRPIVKVGTHDVWGVSRTYEDVGRGAPVAYVGSAKMLEVAVRDGSAAEALGVARGAAVVIVGMGIEPHSS